MKTAKAASIAMMGITKPLARNCGPLRRSALSWQVAFNGGMALADVFGEAPLLVCGVPRISSSARTVGAYLARPPPGRELLTVQHIVDGPLADRNGL
jgi:hypothetical protein